MGQGYHGIGSAFRSRDEGRSRGEKREKTLNVHIWKLTESGGNQREGEKVSIQRSWGESCLLMHHGDHKRGYQKRAGLADHAGVC